MRRHTAQLSLQLDPHATYRFEPRALSPSLRADEKMVPTVRISPADKKIVVALFFVATFRDRGDHPRPTKSTPVLEFFAPEETDFWADRKPHYRNLSEELRNELEEWAKASGRTDDAQLWAAFEGAQRVR